jgi:hypothetical protein
MTAAGETRLRAVFPSSEVRLATYAALPPRVRTQRNQRRTWKVLPFLHEGTGIDRDTVRTRSRLDGWPAVGNGWQRPRSLPHDPGRRGHPMQQRTAIHRGDAPVDSTVRPHP